MTRPLPRLLVSVRNVQEASAALAGGVSILDIKEPAHGSLGKAAPEVIEAIARATAGSVPLSAALGDARDHASDATLSLSARHLARIGFQYLKLGLAGCEDRWQEVMQPLVTGRSLVQPVAVAYADASRVAAPTWQQVLPWAAASGIRTLLVDTAIKDGSCLFDCMGPSVVASLLAQARAAGLEVALAGSLAGDSLDQAIRLGPDILAVRGAACAQGRNSQVEAARVRAIVQRIHQLTGST